MKKFLIAVLVALISCSSAGALWASDNEMDRFDGKSYDIEGNLWVIKELRGDIAKNEYVDTVRLVGLVDEKDNLIERIWLEVIPGYAAGTPEAERPKPFVISLPQHIRGYEFDAELRPFVLDEREQVFLAFRESPNGFRQYSVIQISVAEETGKVIFYSGAMARTILTGEFIGKHRATLHIFDTGLSAVLDLSGRKELYRKEGVFDSKGRIIRPIAISAERFETVKLGEPDSRGIYTLDTTIELFGVNADDHIATVECTMMYNIDFEAWRLVGSKLIPAEGIKIMPQREEMKKETRKKQNSKRADSAESKSKEARKSK